MKLDTCLCLFISLVSCRMCFTTHCLLSFLLFSTRSLYVVNVIWQIYPLDLNVIDVISSGLLLFVFLFMSSGVISSESFLSSFYQPSTNSAQKLSPTLPRTKHPKETLTLFVSKKGLCSGSDQVLLHPLPLQLSLWTLTNCTPKPLELSKFEKATVSSPRVVFISVQLTPTYERGMSSKQDNQASRGCQV